jgi:hypothetical protein
MMRFRPRPKLLISSRASPRRQTGARAAGFLNGLACRGKPAESLRKSEAAGVTSKQWTAPYVRRFVLMKIASFSLVFLLASAMMAQVAAPSAPDSSTTSAPNGASQSLAQLEQVSQSTVFNLGRLKVDKWKIDSHDKDQTRSNIESLQRNLTAALPALVQQVRANPASLAASIKLYRNLNAVYDVLASVTESAGAFGSKDDYNALANDAANFDSVRRKLADDLEQMAASSDSQVARLTSQLRAQQQAAQAAAAPPKHVVVDDTQPAKKKAAGKKKAAAPAKAATAASPQ